MAKGGDGRKDGRTEGRKDGRLEIPPCILQDISPLGPLPKKYFQVNPPDILIMHSGPNIQLARLTITLAWPKFRLDPKFGLPYPKLSLPGLPGS